MIRKNRVKLFVAALRSGDYEQGNGFLESDGKYCCLGVACKVAMLNGCEVEHGTVVAAVYGPKNVIGDLWGMKEAQVSAFDGRTTDLPRSVQEWYGFRGGDPTLDRETGHLRLTMIAANDNLGWDFERIAAALEAKYLEGSDA